MRLPILSFAALCALTTLGQNNPRDLFVIDPYEANGYFITSPDLLDQLGAANIHVDIVSRANDGNGGTNTTILQSFDLDRTTLHSHVLASVIETLPAGAEVAYDAYARNGNNNVVGEIHAWRPGPVLSEKCNLICEQNRHGWKLTAYADGGNGNTAIEITNPARYFFVTTHNGHWEQFKQLNQAEWYGLDDWSNYDCYQESCAESIDCFRIQAPTSPGTQASACVGLPDENGYPLPPTAGNSGCWAIRKDKGAWRDLHQSATEVYSLGSMCDGQPGTGSANLLASYNADDLVENAIATLNPNPGPLNCPNGSLSSVSDSPGSGPSVGCSWIPFLTNSAVEDADGNVEIIEEVLYALHCEEGGSGSSWPSSASVNEMLSRVGGIVIRLWADGKATDVVNIPIPKTADGKAIDPKLIKVVKAELAPGLYEVVVPLNNGLILRHFEQIDQTIVVGASFASFVQMNIYPVPVRDQIFALDFDIAWPMEIAMTIVNNTGAPYLAETLSFELAGRNKHVVKMQTPWPAGIYHAIFQFSDGSTTSRTFTVATPN